MARVRWLKKETDFGEESPAVSCPTSLFLLSDLFTGFQVRWLLLQEKRNRFFGGICSGDFSREGMG